MANSSESDNHCGRDRSETVTVDSIPEGESLRQRHAVPRPSRFCCTERCFKEGPVLFEVVQPVEDLVPTVSA